MSWNESLQRLKPHLGLGIIIGIFFTLALLGSFQVGRMVGLRKASYACGWNRNYGPLVGFPEPGHILKVKHFPNPNGAFGKVLSIDGNLLIIKDQDGTEKSVVLSPTSTTIRQGFDTVQIDAFRIDDTVAIFGHPTEGGQVEATLVRILKPER